MVADDIWKVPVLPQNLTVRSPKSEQQCSVDTAGDMRTIRARHELVLWCLSFQLYQEFPVIPGPGSFAPAIPKEDKLELF